MGSCRKRTPVAANNAFASEGAAATVPGSPMPPGALITPDEVNFD